MRVSVDWLREYLDFDCPLSDLAERLTMAGLEVEAVDELSSDHFTSHGGSAAGSDVVFDCKVTPNRGDWLSMIGVAREAAPLVGSKMKMPEEIDKGTDPASSDLIKISIQDPDLCGRYVGIVVRNVKIGESPDWMKNRLIAVGMRPINNVVDITNYVMMELGQPLHAFDYGLLTGREIIVRRARPGETLVSIDQAERKLDSDMLVIADADHAVAVAGIMGGAESEVSHQTQDILIESANFDRVSIRRTSKRLGMVTESSYRFERGVDPGITALAALRAAELMRDLAGGEIARGMVDVHPCPVEPLQLKARPERINAVLGIDIEADEMAGYLNGLEINTLLENRFLVCRIPTFRSDITREIDLVEEVGRAFGYDKLPMTLPKGEAVGKDSPEGVLSSRIRRILMGCGAQEVLSHSLVDGQLAQLAGMMDVTLKVRNPLSEDMDTMRVALAPNLLQVIARNQARETMDVSVFEIGRAYRQLPEGEIDEKMSVAGAMVGSMWRSAWSLPESMLEADFYACKGVVESLIDGLGIRGARFSETYSPLLHPSRAARVIVGERELGVLGEVSTEVREQLDIRGRPCAFELDFSALMACAPKVMGYEPLPRYPALYRHLAVVVADEVKYEQLTDVVWAAGRDLVENVELLDLYKGEQVGRNRKSLTISIVFRSRGRTLVDEEVNDVLDGIKEALVRETGASFRE